jgi:hypothetical protein
VNASITCRMSLSNSRQSVSSWMMLLHAADARAFRIARSASDSEVVHVGLAQPPAEVCECHRSEVS